ncbi:MAG TPA: hypothetical protein ACHBX0_06270 [Arsenophonus sp.]
MFNYLTQEGNTDKSMQFITDIAKQPEKHEGALMTIAQALRQEGIQKGKLEGIQGEIQIGEQKGIQKGVEKGRMEGEKQASMKIARQMLESGMDSKLVMKFTGLTDDEMINLFED